MESEPNVMGFFVACRNTHIRTAKDLLKHVDPSSLLTTWDGRTCFHVAVIAGDPDLFRELVAKLPVQDFRNIIKTADKKGDTALHLAVRKNRVDLVKQLVGLAANLCDSINEERETPLKLAVSLGFKEAVEFLITRTSNALHHVVELNQVKLVQFLIERNVQLSELINKPYQPTTNHPDSATKSSKPQPDQQQQPTKEKGPINESSQNVDLSELINQPYRPTTNSSHNKGNSAYTYPQLQKQTEGGDEHTPYSPVRENSATKSSDNEGNCATKPQPEQEIHGQEQPTKEKGLIKASGAGGDKSSQSKGDSTNNQQDHPIVVSGDTPLHIATRNKYDHMVNLLLKVPRVDKLALNSEHKTAFDIAREVTEYHESFRTIRKLADPGMSPKAFMDCAPQVTHKKRTRARKRVNEAYRARRDAELVVAGLLAAMTCAAAFAVPGGFESNKDVKDRGSPNLVSLTSFKFFLIFDCISFFLSLFVCIMWEMSSELTTGDKMLFMTVNGLVVCFSFGFTSYGFMCAVYVMLERKVKTFSWVVLGCLIAITFWAHTAFFYQSAQFIVKRARFHRLCGVSCFFDDIVEKVWSLAERCGLLSCLRSGDNVSQDLITGHAVCCGLMNFLRSNDDNNSGPTPEHEVSHSNSPLPYQFNSRSASPLLTRT